MAEQKVQTEKKIKMKEVFVLWKKTSQKGTTYFTGKGEGLSNLVGFFNTNKKNPKEPDLRVYEVHNEQINEVCSLWVSVSKKGNKYLYGMLDGKRITGFINKTEDSKKPYVRVYLAEEQQTITETIDKCEFEPDETEPF